MGKNDAFYKTNLLKMQFRVPKCLDDKKLYASNG